MEKEHLEVILESIDNKFDLVLEGHASLDRKIDDLAQKTEVRFDLVDFKIDALNQKIDGVEESLNKKIDGVEVKLSKKIDTVAADLKAHRADTEAHQVYRVKEG